MRCVYCNKELKSSADDYEGCICSECKKPKYPFQQGILEQQNEIEKLKQENKELKEQLVEKDKQLAIRDKMIDALVYELCAIYDTEGYTYGSNIIKNTKFIKYGKDGHFDKETLEYIKEKYEKYVKESINGTTKRIK